MLVFVPNDDFVAGLDGDVAVCWVFDVVFDVVPDVVPDLVPDVGP